MDSKLPRRRGVRHGRHHRRRADREPAQALTRLAAAAASGLPFRLPHRAPWTLRRRRRAPPSGPRASSATSMWPSSSPSSARPASPRRRPRASPARWRWSPATDDEETLRLIADDLLQRLANQHYPLIRETAENATFLARANWPWAKPVMRGAAEGQSEARRRLLRHRPQCLGPHRGMGGGRRPARPAGRTPSRPTRRRRFLGEILGLESEPRAGADGLCGRRHLRLRAAPAQGDEQHPAGRSRHRASARRWAISRPPISGRGRNNAPVWVSTYTKNLQRQLDQETARLIAEPGRAARTASSSARAARTMSACSTCRRSSAASPRPIRAARLLAALIARWARFTRDGDMVGGDFPSWILSLFNDLALDGESRGVTAAVAGPHRPARRMHLFRLPALPPLLHRALGARRAQRRRSSSPTTRWCCTRRPSTTRWAWPPPRKRKQRPAASAASSSTRAIISSMRRTRPSPAI